jgi:hypothetical protein
LRTRVAVTAMVMLRAFFGALMQRLGAKNVSFNSSPDY